MSQAAPEVEIFEAVKVEPHLGKKGARRATAAKSAAKSAAKAKAKSTARAARGARVGVVKSAPAASSGGASGGSKMAAKKMVLHKRPIVAKEAAGSSEEAEPKEQKQLILNMGPGGAMAVEDPKLGRPRRGPAIGGDFGKVKNRLRTVAKLRDFRSRAYMYRAIWQGRFKKTTGGLKKENLKVGVTGRIVPIRKSDHCRKVGTANGWIAHWKMWLQSTKLARDALGLTGFHKVKKNGTDEEMALFSCVAANYAKEKKKKAAGNDAADGVAAEEDAEEEEEEAAAEPLAVAAGA